MYARKSKKPAVVTIVILGIAVLCGGLFYLRHLDEEIELYQSSDAGSALFFSAYKPAPFINSAVGDISYAPAEAYSDALFSYHAPEGFKILSHSRHWNNEMLELMYHELKLNVHGGEMDQLNEIIIYPYEDDEQSALATYSPNIATAEFYLMFPAFPADFRVEFPIFTGRINIYGGDTKTTIESIAGSLSHEYGHHYTFYYMFDSEMRRHGLLDSSGYGRLREAQRYGLIPTVEMSPEYLQNRYKYIIEIAAEDYVALMGSPTTRQVTDFYDIKQLLEDPGLPRDRIGERNAFPQENMMIPLAIDVQGLEEYFYSFIDARPEPPVEEKQEITLEFTKHSDSFDLETGPRTYEYYTITWNTPYRDAIYTIACYDPYEYLGWGYPIKTVHPAAHADGSASAVIGEYAKKQENMVHSMNDELAQGIKVFYVAAQLPDGTYYTSDMYEFNFG